MVRIQPGEHPEFLIWTGGGGVADTEAIHNLCFILKVTL
jgi:hypothetical protein